MITLKPKPSRKVVLQLIKVAAYEEDYARAQRLYVEHRISRTAYQAALNLGEQERRRDIAEGKYCGR